MMMTMNMRKDQKINIADEGLSTTCIYEQRRGSRFGYDLNLEISFQSKYGHIR